MKDIAKRADAMNIDGIHVLFRPYLNEATHDEWQLTLEHINHNLLGNVEMELFKVTGDVLRLAKTMGYDTVKTNCMGYHERAFSIPPDAAHFVRFDATFSGVSRPFLLRLVVNAVKMLVSKRKDRDEAREFLKQLEADAKEKGINVED